MYAGVPAPVVVVAAPDGRGVLFSGDTIGTVANREWVTFMRSFPNWMPLSGAVVRRIAEHVSRYDFDRLYSNFGGFVPRDARAAVQRSAERYAAWVDGEYDHLPEAAFYMVGSIDEAVDKANQMKK